MGGFRVENQVRLCCPCLFGLESVLSFEIKKIGGENLEEIAQDMEGRISIFLEKYEKMSSRELQEQRYQRFRNI